MSRAFTKETETPAVLPERVAGSHPNYMTPQGLEKLRARIPALQHELLAAGSRGDDAAEQALAHELRWLEARCASAIAIDPARQPPGRVAFGAKVEVEDDDGRVSHWQIVGEDEADAGAGRVSWRSPLACALEGARVGDTVTWARPAGTRELTVRAIAY